MGSASTLEYRFDMNAILLRCERWMRAAATARALADMSSADCPIVGPANHTDENAYDLLLARETDKTKNNFGQLTHSIWSKP